MRPLIATTLNAHTLNAHTLNVFLENGGAQDAL
jgi:hypothetical protein